MSRENLEKLKSATGFVHLPGVSSEPVTASSPTPDAFARPATARLGMHPGGLGAILWLGAQVAILRGLDRNRILCEADLLAVDM